MTRRDRRRRRRAPPTPAWLGPVVERLGFQPAGFVVLNRDGGVELADVVMPGRLVVTYAMKRGGLAGLFQDAWVTEALAAGAVVVVLAEDGHDAVELHRAVEGRSQTRH